MLFNNIYEQEFLLDYYLYKINISFVKSGKKKKKNLKKKKKKKEKKKKKKKNYYFFFFI